MADKKFVKLTDGMDSEKAKSIIEETVKNALKKELDKFELEAMGFMINCESPIEQLMAIALYKVGIKDFYNFNKDINVLEIIAQEEKITGHRVDFNIHCVFSVECNAFDVNFVIECDSFEFHSNKENMIKDYKRTRELQIDNNYVLKFTGSEIYKDPVACAEEVREFILSTYYFFAIPTEVRVKNGK